MDDTYTGNIEGKIDTGYLLLPEYNNFLIKKANENTRKHDHFHPSAFGGCLRKIVLQYFGEKKSDLKEPKEITPRLERIFDAGHAFHYRMQKAFSDMGIIRGNWKSKITGKTYGLDSKIGIFRPSSLKEIGEDKYLLPDDKREIEELLDYEEIQLSDEEYNFKGRCDAIVEMEKGDENTRYVVDFKTCNSEKFEFLATKSRKPDSEYITQINIYMWLSGVHKGIIFYEDKNNHEVIEFHVPFSEKRIDMIKKTSKKLIDFIENKKIPTVPDGYTPTTKPCTYCGYTSICFRKDKK